MRYILAFWFLVIVVFGGFAQPELDDAARAEIVVIPDPLAETIQGEVRYIFSDATPTDSLVLDARNMLFEKVTVDGIITPFTYNGRTLTIPVKPRKKSYSVAVRYTATPTQAVYFHGWQDSISGNEQIWTQGQGKYSSHWVPSFDAMTRKVRFNLTIHADSAYTVIANGALQDTTPSATGKAWRFRMQHPMSSYLLGFAIGRFQHLEERSGKGVPLLLYYPEGRLEEAQRTYRGTRWMFDFLEREIGIAYPWSDYKQVPVHDFIYAGMENTGATFFSDTYLADSLAAADLPFTQVNAHELAHQWFGNLVTETEASEHWLHEGFATYYSYLAESDLKEDPHWLPWTLLRTSQILEREANSNRVRALVDPEAGSLVFYEKGAWALYALRNLVGDVAFRAGMVEYLNRYAFANATVADFLQVMEGVSGRALDHFAEQWLWSEGFPADRAQELLRQASPDLAAYLAYAAADSLTTSRLDTLEHYWNRSPRPEYRSALLRRYSGPWQAPLLEWVAREEIPSLARVLMECLPRTEPWMQPYLETWLDGGSYQLREYALFALWQGFPPDRHRYLDQAAQNGSLGSMRLSQLWWVLAVVTENYAPQAERLGYLQALQQTTSPFYHREIRENAFRLLHQLGLLAEQNLRDLIRGTEHYGWEFRLYCRRLLDQLMADRPDPDFWEAFREGFPPKDFRYFHQKLEQL